jgi:hypothetical protein
MAIFGICMVIMNKKIQKVNILLHYNNTFIKNSTRYGEKNMKNILFALGLLLPLTACDNQPAPEST